MSSITHMFINTSPSECYDRFFPSFPIGIPPSDAILPPEGKGQFLCTFSMEHRDEHLNLKPGQVKCLGTEVKGKCLALNPKDRIAQCDGFWKDSICMGKIKQNGACDGVEKEGTCFGFMQAEQAGRVNVWDSRDPSEYPEWKKMQNKPEFNELSKSCSFHLHSSKVDGKKDFYTYSFDGFYLAGGSETISCPGLFYSHPKVVTVILKQGDRRILYQGVDQLLQDLLLRVFNITGKFSNSEVVEEKLYNLKREIKLLEAKKAQQETLPKPKDYAQHYFLVQASVSCSVIMVKAFIEVIGLIKNHFWKKKVASMGKILVTAKEKQEETEETAFLQKMQPS